MAGLLELQAVCFTEPFDLGDVAVAVQVVAPLFGWSQSNGSTVEFGLPTHTSTFPVRPCRPSSASGGGVRTRRGSPLRPSAGIRPGSPRGCTARLSTSPAGMVGTPRPKRDEGRQRHGQRSTGQPRFRRHASPRRASRREGQHHERKQRELRPSAAEQQRGRDAEQ